jgi:hypothetical protein
MQIEIIVFHIVFEYKRDKPKYNNIKDNCAARTDYYYELSDDYNFSSTSINQTLVAFIDYSHHPTCFTTTSTY